MSKDDLYVMRKRKKIKLKDLSAHMGISISLLSRYENNLYNFTKRNQKMYEDYIINKKLN
ncbi:helix-turn-helix transcriptional regulator [Lysinibacillus sp. FSL K6-0232]|uniref:helix-turn-helix domain-containing protein n=1 Tax=Lysinibacillus sp. FSL K6-0232 TaxID=2921425 RepID=UPI0030FC4978